MAVKNPRHARISFIGGPGTGKSTLAQALNVHLKLAGYDSEFAPEFARAYLRRSGPLLNVMEQFIIFAGAASREDELAIHGFCVCDSGSFLSEVYYQYERAINPTVGDTPEEQAKLEQGLYELRRMCRKRLLSTDHLFFVPSGHFDSGDDPTRRYVEHQELLSRRIRAYLDNNDADYHVVEATALGDRVDEVLGALAGRGAFPGSRRSHCV